MPTLRSKKVTVARASDPSVIIATFNDYSVLPPGATEFICDVSDGWSDTSELNVALAQIYGVDGQVAPDKFYYQARHITLAGAVEGVNEDSADELDDFIRSVFPRNVDLVITKHDSTPKFVIARVYGKRESTRGRQDTATGFRFTIPLVCTDPLKYGVDLLESHAGVSGFSSGGRTYPRVYPLVYTTSDNGSSQVASILNSGNGDSPPVFIIQGPLGKGWFLQNITTGDILSVNLALLATDVLIIDCGSQVMTLNGYDRVSETIQGTFFKLQPGWNEIKLFATYNTFAGFRIQAYSAYE